MLRPSEQFFREVWASPVPLDTRVLRALKNSPMALDVYAWASYRVHTLNRAREASAVVPWEQLRLQFGAGYSDDVQGLRNFRKAFLRGSPALGEPRDAPDVTAGQDGEHCGVPSVRSVTTGTSPPLAAGGPARSGTRRWRPCGRGRAILTPPPSRKL